MSHSTVHSIDSGFMDGSSVDSVVSSEALDEHSREQPDPAADSPESIEPSKIQNVLQSVFQTRYVFMLTTVCT